jgi:hypothetical protein
MGWWGPRFKRLILRDEKRVIQEIKPHYPTSPFQTEEEHRRQADGLLPDHEIIIHEEFLD